MSPSEFERIIKKSESSTLDFKAKMYDFKDDKDFSKISKFVKDIISFSNTIRNEKSYIIIGIQEDSNGLKTFYGLDLYIDDAILQDKIKDKVYPRPHFNFFTFDYNSQKYGVFEFPIVIPTIRAKGLDVGKIYYRHGTTNAEASGLEVIRINDWLRSLNDNNQDNNLNDEITYILKQLTSKETKLSTILSELLNISKKYELVELSDFCISEIKGIPKYKLDSNQDLYRYRVQNVFISLNKIEINPYSFYKVTTNLIKKEMEQSRDFFEAKFLFPNPISEIEDYVDMYKNSPDSYGSIELRANQIFPDKEDKDYPIMAYVFVDTYIDLYRNIRQKVIDKLIDI